MADDLDRFLAEDLGEGDLTTQAVLAATGPRRVTAHLVAREAQVVAGLAEAAAVFTRRGGQAELRAEDGTAVPAGTVLAVVRGPAEGVLAAERLALNFLMRMGGIATMTRRLADQARAVNPRCAVAATRKTTPGFRAWEKRAVVLGGGEAHRARLDSAFLVKDNHLALGLAVGDVVAACRRLQPQLFLQVEADRAEQAEAAARAGADAVLLDNMPPAVAEETAAKARALRPGLLVEVSGGIRAEDIPRYARFADRISLGRITLGAPPVDVGLDFIAVE